MKMKKKKKRLKNRDLKLLFLSFFGFPEKGGKKRCGEKRRKREGEEGDVCKWGSFCLSSFFHYSAFLLFLKQVMDSVLNTFSKTNVLLGGECGS